MSNCKSFCVVCTRTLYSCHWAKPQETTRSKQKACLWFTIVAVVTALAITWMYICLVSYNDQEDVNWKFFTALKLWINWFMVLIILSALLSAYCVFLLCFALIQVALKEPLDLHWSHKILLFGGILLIAAGVTGISFMWQQEWLTVQLSLEATAPFLQFGAVGALTLMSKLVFQAIFTTGKKFSRYIIGTAFAVVSIAIFLSPLGIRSPCFIEKQHLPAKPKLIGHRGAPMLAPENTIMSFNRSISCGVTAFETDIQLSKDDIPFLMHDHHSNFLLRTTDATYKFPNKNLKRSTSLTWAEYQSLNAGEWFVQTDPFRTVSQLSEDEKVLAKNQTIPSLLQLLNLAQQHNISVMFDLYSPNEENDTVKTVETIELSGINHSLILWLPPTKRDYVRARAPRFTQVYNNIDEMKGKKGNHLNLKYSKISTTEIRLSAAC
ncbi:glycerophosphoinositol inositolphosphodiesterase GDPD2 isoform X2 [Boleophthalmus pectinirostris]|uniref:glycerophosphoinositol inositolphosphodiesterase GDPD2 isoform X2 n=1 Tax=Boleophthalmus pectinirostris TaxID=150288 RepID=UPI00242E9910|nr:glycerophosphoinositol inositolphosphodiesterase GDPD2 isoform X2 [Boleophthalmus pectinirostris]